MQRKKNNQTKNSSLPTSNSKRVGIVVSGYNHDITYPMRDGAIQTLKAAGIKEESIIVVEAPGAFEIPILCQRLIQAKPNSRSRTKPNGRSSKKVDGIIAIGCVIKGDTDHYHFIAQESTRGIMDVMLKTGVPISNAILTVNNLKQAQIRSKGSMNKGVEAATALLSILATKN